MLRTKNTIIAKISTRENYCNTILGFKIQGNTEGPRKKISTSIDQILHSKLNLETCNSAGSVKSTIPKPYEVTTTGGNQENEVKSSEVTQKPYKVSAVTYINSASTICHPISASKTTAGSCVGKPINFFHVPVHRNFRTRKKCFRVPKYIQYNMAPKSGNSFDVGTEKWATEQFSNRNFTSIASIPNLKPVFSSIQRNCSYHSSAFFQGLNIPGLRKEHVQSTINTMAHGKCIHYKPCIVIMCTIFRIAVLDRVETSLRSGKSANVHIDSFSNQWDKSQLLEDGYLLGNMLHCLTVITGSTLRQDLYQRTLFLEVIDEIRENIYSTCKHLAFTQYNSRKKWIFRRVNLTTQHNSPTRTSRQMPNTTTASTSKQQESLLDYTNNIPLHESWQEFSAALHPITPATFHLVPSISRLLENDPVFNASEIARVLKVELIKPTQELSYRQFHVAFSTMSRVAAIKHIFFHITNDPHPTRDTMMTAYNSYIKFPDPTFNMLAHHYLYAETRHQLPTNINDPKQHLIDALFKILRQIEDISNTFLTALHLESTTGIPYPNLILDHPTLNTPAISVPSTQYPHSVPSGNSPQSQFIANAFCAPSPETLQLYKNIWPTNTWLTVADFCLSAPIQLLVAYLPDPKMFFNVFEPIPIDAKLTSQVCTILVNTIWRQTSICHVGSALWQTSTNDSFIARDSIVECYGHFCGYEDTVLHTLLQDSLYDPPTLVAKSLVFRALESIITNLGLIACDLLRLEYPVNQTQGHIPAPSLRVGTTDAPLSLPQAPVDQSYNLSAPTPPTQDNQEQTPLEPDNTMELEDLFESLAQVFLEFTPLLYTDTPLIPLPEPTDLSNTGGVPGPGWGPGGVGRAGLGRAQKNSPSSGQKCFK